MVAGFSGGEAGPHQGPRPLLLPPAAPLSVLMALILAFLLASCGSLPPETSEETGSKAVEAEGPPVVGMVATLEDEVRELPNGRISWSTDWVLCWEPYPGATAYELRTLTIEGAAPEPTDRNAADQRCYRLEVATGENARSDGMLGREEALMTQRSQLSYRVRAVLDGGRIGEWSAPATVGRAGRIADLTPGTEYEPHDHLHGHKHGQEERAADARAGRRSG